MIEVVIDELVIRGVAPGDAEVAAAALEARLALLAGDGDVAPLARAGDGLGARGEALARRGVNVPAAKPAALGEAVAGAVWGAISSGGGR